ncbi:MAG: soluble lytic murein transglycosylase, partial [Gammaproteobacteria bacterium]|jgi:soluble lytic murein transglycosylase
MVRWLCLFCGLFLAGTLHANIDLQRKLFKEASIALSHNKMDQFANLLTQLNGYPIKPYLQYDHFVKRIERANVAEVKAFLDQHKDYPFAFALRGKWLSVLADRQDWHHYLEFFDNRIYTRLKCLAFQARLKLGKLDNIEQDIQKVWLRGSSQPNECNQPFDYFLSHHAEPNQVIWQRIEKAFKERSPSLAKYLGQKLDEPSQLSLNLWYEAHQRPEKALRNLIKADDLDINRKIITHTIIRLARKNASSARQFWLEMASKFNFSQQQSNSISQQIAISSAHQKLAIAAKLLNDLPDKLKTDKVFLLLTNIYLKHQNWTELVKTIKQMPSDLHMENEWQYWLARATEALGDQASSGSLYLALSKKPTYYGFLAADKLMLPYKIEQQDANELATLEESVLLQENKHLFRARELFFINRMTDANREWFRAIKHLDPPKIKQAAALASSWKWHDSAIRTVAKTAHRSDYNLRFPMPYREKVMRYSKANQLDPSIVYGVMRRESLFNANAKSHAGALGLMQLMPATARYVAKGLGLKKPNHADILIIENNINYGTRYFRTVLNRFDDNVSLAAAAYNAGPSRVKRWLPLTKTMPADLWIAIVPYKETRNYIQAVLAYATVFDTFFEKDVRISSRMMDIKTDY